MLKWLVKAGVVFITVSVVMVVATPHALAQLCFDRNNWGAPPTPCHNAGQHGSAPAKTYTLPKHLQRKEVELLENDYPAGTIVVNTEATYLYYVLGNDKAIRYGIGVARDEDFSWRGVETVSRKAKWPDWHPPAEMRERQPYLPVFMAGGPGNPLGARALYLGKTLYRIHGTDNPKTIGTRVSSGCIRLTNEDVIDLYNRVKVGATVVVQ